MASRLSARAAVYSCPGGTPRGEVLAFSNDLGGSSGGTLLNTSSNALQKKKCGEAVTTHIVPVGIVLRSKFLP